MELSFLTVWMGLEAMMLSEIGQVLKEIPQDLPHLCFNLLLVPVATPWHSISEEEGFLLAHSPWIQHIQTGNSKQQELEAARPICSQEQ